MKKSATPVALFLFLLLVGGAGSVTASGWLGGESVPPVAVTLHAIDTGSIGMQAPQQATGWWLAAGVSRAPLAGLLYAGRTPTPDLPAEGGLVAFALGEKPTGGFAVELLAARLEGDVLIVDVRVTEPPSDAMVIQMISCPFAVASVEVPEGSTVKRVEFHDATTGKRLAKAQ